MRLSPFVKFNTFFAKQSLKTTVILENNLYQVGECYEQKHSYFSIKIQRMLRKTAF
jgi:hypothetical protein